MKRDMDLIRTIMMRVADAPYDGRPHRIAVEGRSDTEVSCHIKLLAEKGLIEARDFSSMDGICWQAVCLTDSGHDFLDLAKNDTAWVKAKDKVVKSIGTLSLEALKIALNQIVQSGMHL